MRLELPFYHYAHKYLEKTYDAQIVDYFELLGTPENRTLRTYERIEEVCRTLENIRRISNYNENRFTME